MIGWYLLGAFTGFIIAALILESIGWFTPDGVSALANVGLLLVAILGFGVWRAQIKGQASHATALSLLRWVYRVRETFMLIRQPHVAMSREDEPENAHELSADELSHYRYASAMQRRWDAFNAHRTERDVVGFDARALWGEAPGTILAKLTGLERKMFVALVNHLAYRHPRRQDRPYTETDDKVSREADALLYGLTEGDPFRAEYDAVVLELETYLKPYLRD